MSADSPGTAARDATLADLRLRLHGSRAQERAARAEARLLARELALTRRLLGFYRNAGAAGRAVQPPAASFDPVPRVQAVRWTEPARFHLDACRPQAAQTLVSGWAFRPVAAWDARAASVIVLFRQGGETWAATTVRTRREDVAAYFANQPAGAGGARELASAGFACEVVNASLPGGVDLEIVLRLECAGSVCEQPTGQHLRF